MTERVARLDARPIPLECLRVERMANGWSQLLLTELIGWDGFPVYAEAIAEQLGGRLDEVVDGPDIRMRGLVLDLRCFWLVYEDFPIGVTIEPRSELAAVEIARIHAELSTLAQPTGS